MGVSPLLYLFKRFFILYSNQQISIQKKKSRGFDSCWHTSNVFTGDYWDEFGLLLAQKPSADKLKVLVLGAGKGACVRPILASHSSCKITLVDTDKKSLLETKKIFEDYFPDIQCLEFVHNDAEAFLESCRSEYDLIWVDLYTNTGYAPCMNHQKFYSKLNDVLSFNGSVAVNCFTTASPLSIEQLGVAESFVASKLQTITNEVSYIPYRRNMTMIASRKNRQFRLMNIDHLKIKDQLVLNIQKHRIKYKKNVLISKVRDSLPDFEGVDKEFASRWNNSGMLNNNYLHSVLKNESINENDLSEITSSSKNALSFLSVVIGGMNHKYLDEIFLKWSFDRILKFSVFSKTELDYFLTQFVSVVVRSEIDHERIEFLNNKINILEIV